MLEVRGTSNVLPALSDAGQPAASRPAGKDASSQTKILPTQVDAPQILPVAPQLDAPQNQQEPEFIPIDPEPVLDQGGAAPQDKHAGDQNPKVKESGAAPDMVEKTQQGQRADESDLPPPLPSPLPPLSPPPSPPPPPLPSLPESGQPMMPRPIIGQPSGTPLVVTPPVPIVEQPLFAVAAMPEKESEDPADKPENKGGDLTQFKLEPEAQKDRVMTETEAQQDTQYHPVGAGDWSNDGRSLALVGSSSLDPESRVSPNGSIIYLSTGGSTAHPQIVTLGAGVDNVIYRIGIGSTRNGWEPFDGVQEIRNFKIGTDKLWFARTERNPEWQHDLKGLETGYQDAKITYSILDYGGAAGFIPGSVLGVKISGAFIGGMPIVAHQLELRFDNLDDQRRSFDILAKQQNSFEQGRLSVFAEIMGDSLNFINQWSDLGLGSDLPDLSQLPEIV